MVNYRAHPGIVNLPASILVHDIVLDNRIRRGARFDAYAPSPVAVVGGIAVDSVVPDFRAVDVRAYPNAG